jgi:hypothetical protein
LEENALTNATEVALQRLRKESDRLGNGRGLKEAIVRVKLKLRTDQALVREEELRHALEKEFEVYYIAAISQEVERSRRTRLAGVNVEELTPLELLKKYLETKSIAPQRLEILLKHADALIHGITPELAEEPSENMAGVSATTTLVST